MDRLPSSPTGTGVKRPAAGPEPVAAGVATGARSGSKLPAVTAPEARSTARGPRRIGPITIDRRSTAVAAAIAALLAGVAWAGTGYRYEPYADAPAAPSGKLPAGDRELRQLVARLDRRSRDLAARLKATAPRGVYIVIDQTQNRLYLKRDDDTLLEARCSAGSGMVLEGVGGQEARVGVRHAPRTVRGAVDGAQPRRGRSPTGPSSKKGSRSRRTRPTGSRPGRSASTPSTSATGT